MYTPYRTYRIYCFYFNHIRSSAKNQPIFLSSFLNFALLFTTRIKNPHSRFLRKCGFNFYGFIRFSYGLKRIGPLGKRLFVHAVHDLALFPVRVRAHGFKAVKRFAHTAAAGGRKWNHRLAGKIVLLKERIDDCRRHIPPNRKLKCSQFPSCVDFTGFNCIQNCVYCYYLSFFSKIALKHRPHYFHI